MSVISNAWNASAFFLSILAVLSAVRNAIQLRGLQDQLVQSSASRVKLLETSIAELRDELEGVANRLKMMRVRAATNHVRESTAEPDPYKDPDAWRRSMNRKLADKIRGA